MTLDTAPRPRAQHRAPRRRRTLPKGPLGIALLFLAGLLVLLYPTISSWFAQYHQSQHIADYGRVVDATGPQHREEVLADARRYNEVLTGGAVVDAFARLPAADAGPGTGYDSLLAADDRGLMARLRIPAIDVDLPIFHGTDDEVLLEGIGHLEGTALPVGGPGTHSVLTGHRGLAEATMLTHLDRLGVGDRFTVETFGEVLTYEVTSTAVVEPHETQTLHPRPGEDLMTLVTCTPIGVNSHRILVTGERVVPTPVTDLEAAGETPDLPRFPWWAVVLVSAVAALGRYVWRAGRPAGSAPSVAVPADATGASSQ